VHGRILLSSKKGVIAFFTGYFSIPTDVASPKNYEGSVNSNFGQFSRDLGIERSAAFEA
jgi:hypothetical protein